MSSLESDPRRVRDCSPQDGDDGARQGSPAVHGRVRAPRVDRLGGRFDGHRIFPDWRFGATESTTTGSG